MTLDAAKTIERLREQGYQVRVRHIRRWQAKPALATLFDAKNSDDVFPSWQLDQRGGKTVVAISKDEEVLAIGETIVSDKDNYDKRVGLIKALGRALGELKSQPGVLVRLIDAELIERLTPQAKQKEA